MDKTCSVGALYYLHSTKIVISSSACISCFFSTPYFHYDLGRQNTTTTTMSKLLSPIRTLLSTPYQLLIHGKLGFVTTTVSALFILNYVIVPNYVVVTATNTVDPSTFIHQLCTLLASVLPNFVLNIYDPYHDHTVNLIALGALLGYYLTVVGCTIVDILAYRFKLLHWKTQEAKSFFTIKQWCQAVGMSTFNILLMSWFVTVPTWYMHKHGWFHFGAPLTNYNDAWNWKSEVPKQIAHVFIIDVWFFLTHRLIHVKSGPINLYKSIHKFHHSFTAPCAPACMYAHPLEFCIGNVMGIIIGPAITNCHPITSCFWLTFSLVSTSSTHSGYHLLGAQNHDWHHEHFDYNYGTAVFMDKLFDTNFVGSERYHRVMKRKNLKKKKLEVAAKTE